jgi:transcriptional regulator GlxA family with amidase domain
VVYPGFQILDLTGPHEVFAQVGHHVPETSAYCIETVAAAGGPVRADGGLAVVPTSTIEECHGPIDTLVVYAVGQT